MPKAQDPFAQVLRGDLSVRDAAELTGIPEPRLANWVTARRSGWQVPRPRKGRAHSPQALQAVALYRDQYLGMPIAPFRKALEVKHDIRLSFYELRLALLDIGALPPHRRARTEPAPAPGDHGAAAPTTAPNGATPEEKSRSDDERLARNLQAQVDRVAQLSCLVRDRIVAWRCGRGSIHDAATAFAELVQSLATAKAAEAAARDSSPRATLSVEHETRE